MEETGPHLIMSWRSVMMAMVVAPTLLCGLILLCRKVEAIAARALGLALILAAVSMGPQIIGFAGAYQLWPWLTFFPLFTSDLWLGPLLILHAHALMRGTPMGWRWALLLPGIIQTLYYCGAFFLPGDGLFDHEAKWVFNNSVHEPFVMPMESLLGIGLLLFALAYLWRERRIYLAFLEASSSAARDYDPVWLRNLVIILVLTGILYSGLELAEFLGDPSYSAMLPAQVLLIALLCWLGLDAAWRLQTAFPKITQIDTAPTPTPPGLADRILEKMVNEQWFLEPRLSVRDVARRLGTNESYVSRALNRQNGESFNRYVNTLRVDFAKSKLRNTPDSILSIAMDSGFNSKATFNRVFRDLTGETPSRFRTSQNP